MPTCYLTRVVHFSAEHRYFRPDWSADQNTRTFGDAGRDHAHAYQCAVTVRGTPDPSSGMIVDLALLDRVLAEEIVQRFDGRHINRDVAEFAYGKSVPTGEMLCQDVWRRVAKRLPGSCALTAVRVQEENTLYAEYRGEA